MTKSPVRLAREALAVAHEALPAYAAVHSPKKFTQPQLIATLVLRQFFKADYRGIIALLKDMSDLRESLGLEELPHVAMKHHRLDRGPSQNRRVAASSSSPLCFIVIRHASWRSLFERVESIGCHSYRIS
jgi:hypothetical protein